MSLRPAKDLGQLLDRAEGDAVAGGKDQRRHHRGADERGAEQFADAGPLERASRLLLGPHGALGQERPDEDQRQGGDDAGDECVPPGLVVAVDRRQCQRELRREDVGQAHEQTTERGKRLRPPERTLPLPRVGEQFGEPCHRGHEFHAYADEHEAAEEQQLRQRRGKPRRQRRQRVEQDAEREHPPPPQQVGEVAAQQTEDAAGDRGHEEQSPRPLRVFGRTRHEQRHARSRRASQRRERRLDHQR